MAIKDFYDGYANGKKDYLDELRTFTLNLYKRRSTPKSQYFLDKTPRYHLICDEIINMFPDGKFILLWRNPLAVASSILQHWCKGKWKIGRYNIDLFGGITNLLNTSSSNNSIIHTIKYEDLVQNPQIEINNICDYISIDYNDQMVNSFYDTDLLGRMGDKTGLNIYRNKVSKDSLNSWKNTYSNPYRRNWAINYLTWIGQENLRTMGYDYFQLKSDVKTNKKASIKSICLDILYTIYYKSNIFLSPLKAHNNQNHRYLFM